MRALATIYCLDCRREVEPHPTHLCGSCEQARRYAAASTLAWHTRILLRLTGALAGGRKPW